MYIDNLRCPLVADLSRLDYRQGWDSDFLKYLQDLERRKNKPVIACGDFNVAHRDIDLARPQQNRGKHGFTDQEREGFDKLLAGGFVDSFRHLHGDMSSCYTYWSMQSGARKSNVGWRIDYFLASTKLAQQSNITRAFILDDVEGSDHCPIGIEVKF
jgi:exodeoxyribonuclease-3